MVFLASVILSKRPSITRLLIFVFLQLVTVILITLNPDRQPQNNQYAASGQQQYQQNQPQDTEPDQTRVTVVPHTRNKHFMW